MDYREIDKKINEFISDENLLKALNWQRSINIFDICNFNETKHSTFLSWLFDPKEAHGLNDLPIKELLKECINKYNQFNDDDKRKKELSKNSFFKEKWSAYDIDSVSFSGTIVFTEFKAGDSNEMNYPKIDLCLVCEEQGVMIFIENKYGSRESGEQTPKYFKYLNSKYRKIYDYRLFVYLDYYFSDNSKYSVDDNWIVTNYNWVKIFIKSILDQNILNNHVEKILKDYYINISEDYGFDPYYSSCKESIKRLSRDHSELLDILKTETAKKYNKLIKDVLFEEIEELCKNKRNDAYRKIFTLYKKYSDILDDMEEYSFYDFIAESVQKELKLKDELVEIESKYLAITHPDLAEWEDENEGWPIFIRFEEYTHEDQKKYELYIYIDLGIVPEGYEKKVEKFIRDYLENDQSINRRYNRIKKELFEERPKGKEELKLIVDSFVKQYKILSKFVDKNLL
jgi:hypothetical protein